MYLQANRPTVYRVISDSLQSRSQEDVRRNSTHSRSSISPSNSPRSPQQRSPSRGPTLSPARSPALSPSRSSEMSDHRNSRWVLIFNSTRNFVFWSIFVVQYTVCYPAAPLFLRLAAPLIFSRNTYVILMNCLWGLGLINAESQLAWLDIYQEAILKHNWGIRLSTWACNHNKFFVSESVTDAHHFLLIHSYITRRKLITSSRMRH